MIILSEYISFLNESISNNIYNVSTNYQKESRDELKKYVNIDEIESKIIKIDINKNPKKDVDRILYDVSNKLKNISDKKLVKSIILMVTSYIIIGIVQLTLHNTLKFVLNKKSLKFVTTVLTYLFTVTIIDPINKEIIKHGKLKISTTLINYFSIISITLPKIFLDKNILPNRATIFITFILNKLLKNILGKEYEKIIIPMNNKLRENILKVYNLIFSISILRLLPQ